MAKQQTPTMATMVTYLKAYADRLERLEEGFMQLVEDLYEPVPEPEENEPTTN